VNIYYDKRLNRFFHDIYIYLYAYIFFFAHCIDKNVRACASQEGRFQRAISNTATATTE